MRNELFTIIVFLTTITAYGQWKPIGDKIKTQWAENIDPNTVHREYPRPVLVRKDWKNLNGLWNYSITTKGDPAPDSFDNKILVPFPIESSLSGVKKRISQENEIWYYRTFNIPSEWKKKQIILHFGGVDWKSEVWVNDKKAGVHQGGYSPFSFNVTPYLKNQKNQKLVVKVWDPTDKGYQPIGKQTDNPRGIWYTPVTGIWQTVWLEPVDSKYIELIHTTPNIDKNHVSIKIKTSERSEGDYFKIIVKEGNAIISTTKASVESKLEIPITNPKLWSPESPFLYDMEINLVSGGEIVDGIKSYFAMRKISTKKNANGIFRLQLNNEDYFQFGTLDQGWWPDGLYTAPSDDALKYDIEKTKELGFNMIRKHVKVEPARWYYHTDKIGMLVWQDMPNVKYQNLPKWQRDKYFDGTEFIPSAEAEINFRNEWKEIMNFLYSNQSIVCWVPFNESWGQFKTKEISEWTKKYDPNRLVNPASGGNYYKTGDITDIHNYPEPKILFHENGRVNVLGEYGGIGLAIDGHLWQPDENWGYVKFKNSKEATDQYVKLANQLHKMIPTNFSAAIYTQTTDVEIEVNGLMTYDRKVIKLDMERVREINQKICRSLSNQNSKNLSNPVQTIELITLLGDTLRSPEIKKGKSFDQFKSAQTTYFDNQNNAEALIWYGRRAAYLGYYQEAIKFFTLGIKNYSNDARFYRHRGHRYISTRQYDKAISDFKKAVELINGQVDQIEPDGLPNPKNIPLGTLHGNIWYHLGLAYYLKNDMENALRAFKNRSVTHKYDDNIVSGGHWLYMINRRLNKIDESNAVVNEVHPDMDIIENMSYHQSCLFYKGELKESEMNMDEVALYTLANWYVYEKNDTTKAKEYYQTLLNTGNPYSFAYIAGESDWIRLFKEDKNAL